MEDGIELGLTGLEKFADRYHDTVYDKLPEAQALRHPRQTIRNHRHRRAQSDPRAHPEETMPPQDPNSQVARNRDYNYDDRYPPNGYQENRGYGAPRGDDRSRYQEERYRGSRRDSFGADEDSDYEVKRAMTYDGDNRRSRRYDDRYASGPSSKYNAERDAGYRRGRDKRDYDNDRQGRPARGDDRKGDRSDDKSHSGANIGASVAGALAGGLLGNEVGHGDALGMVAGAIVGAIGAHKLEHRYEQKKSDRDQQAWDDGPGGRRDRHRRRRSR